MLEDQLRLALKKSVSEILVRPTTDGSMKNSRNGIIAFGKIPLAHESQRNRSSQRYSQASSGTRNTRRVKLNNRGIKEDNLSQQYLSKQYDNFTTTYNQDFKRQAQTNDLLKFKVSSVDALKPTTPSSEQSPLNLQEKILSQISQSEQSVNSANTGSVFNILDTIPANDPIWTYILPESILNDPNVNLEKVIEENYDYFSNLIGLVFQERFQRDFTNTKLHLPSNIKPSTVYSNDFKRRSCHFTSPNLTAQLYEQQRNNQQNLGTSSAYQQHYKPQEIILTETCKPAEQKHTGGMSMLTSYQLQYLNNKVGPPTFIKKVYNKTTGSLPFIGKSSYQDQYKNNELESQHQTRVKNLRGPFAQAHEMIYTTSLNNDAFRPYQLGNLQSVTQSVHVPPNKQQPEPLQKSFQGQFATTLGRAMRHPTQAADPDPFHLGNRKLWKKRLLQKMEELRAQK